MRILPLSEIYIPTRQRKKIDTKELHQLRDSIVANGLFHPVLVRASAPSSPAPYTLVAGERRFRALELIAAEGAPILCNDQAVMPGHIPTLSIGDVDTLKLMQIELDENLMREALPWQDRVEALAAIHALKQEANAGQTKIQTARELKEEANLPQSERQLQNQLTRANVIREHMDNPTIANARSEREAYNLALKAEIERAETELVRRRTSAMEREATVARKPSIEMLHGDSNELMKKLPEGRFDLILADPPYAINVNTTGLRRRTVHHHNYSDRPEDAKKIIQTILLEGFRVTKPEANLFLFCDINLWDWIQRSATTAGWTPFRTPILWQKSTAEGLAPWGRQGFIRTYEIIFFATKGKRGLLRSPLDILTHKRVPRHERIYGAEKPVALLSELIDASTFPGDEVLDPCAGSGSTLAAAFALKRKALGIEIDEGAYNTASSRVFRLLEGKEDEDLDALRPALESEVDEIEGVDLEDL